MLGWEMHHIHARTSYSKVTVTELVCAISLLISLLASHRMCTMRHQEVKIICNEIQSGTAKSCLLYICAGMDSARVVSLWMIAS